MKRTVLAGRARLNYAALIRYLKFLKTLRWVDFAPDSGSLISVTTIGRSFRKLLEKEDNPPDMSEEVLEKLVTLSHEENVSTQYEKNGSQARMQVRKDKDAGHIVDQSCLFCGNIIKGRAITRKLEGGVYSFDKRECATLFMKFRDVYGKEFLL